MTLSMVEGSWSKTGRGELSRSLDRGRKDATRGPAIVRTRKSVARFYNYQKVNCPEELFLCQVKLGVGIVIHPTKPERGSNRQRLKLFAF